MRPKQNWRLSKTLGRHIEVRPIENDDVQYAWAAYKKGGLGGMGAPFDQGGLDAKAFKEAFEVYVLTNAHAAWTVMASTRSGIVPIGIVLGGWAPPRDALMLIIGIVWFPWASRRNIVEGAVGFFNRIRKEMAWMGFASEQHKGLYETCCKHGIMHRVGTSHRSGQPIAVYEGRN